MEVLSHYICIHFLIINELHVESLIHGGVHCGYYVMKYMKEIIFYLSLLKLKV